MRANTFNPYKNNNSKKKSERCQMFNQCLNLKTLRFYLI